MERKDVSSLQAIRVLKAGGVIAYPTETTYGFGCDPRDAKAVRRIFKIKGRPDGKPVLLVAASIAQVAKVADLTRLTPAARRTFRELSDRYWPGPLTFVLPVRRNAKLARLLTPKNEVAIRISSSSIVSDLTRRFAFPIVSTSANRSGEEPARSAAEIIEVFSPGSGPDLILDGGRSGRGKASTLARILPNGDIEVLRQGRIRLKLSV